MTTTISLHYYKKLVDQELARYFRRKIKPRAGANPFLKFFYNDIESFCLEGGKRLRPLLAIIAYSFFKKPTRNIIQASLALEFLQSVLLIHDDIIDRSDIRRGRPALHRAYMARRAGYSLTKKELSHFGESIAIVAGDIQFAFVNDVVLFSAFSLWDRLRVLDCFDAAMMSVAEGEFLDIVYGLEKPDRIKEKDITRVHILKTAIYSFELPVSVGTIFGGASEKDKKIFSRAAILLGEAFQVQDDIIGLFDSSSGKPLGQDLEERKKTFLIAKALERGSSSQKKIISSVLGKKRILPKDLLAVQHIVRETGSLSYSYARIKNRISKAENLITRIKGRNEGNVLFSELLRYLFPADKRFT